IKRNRLQMEMDGMEVFSFAMKTAPNSVTELLEYCKVDKESIDYFFFHQANFYMVKKIIKKLKINPDKAPFSMLNYGNTGASSIPFTMITEKAEELRNNKLTNVGCSFGVGLSWASLKFETDHLVIPDLIIY
ncbi:MAG: 3-oxoacyl-[acyl-carrier-protein] synthase III C-terminal domain-containing protein, partial [Prevotellaceae bacterium]|nr:3-oxoacyl-[acyl-carrier-protein] synthase III C-terminal domain-containing protein [Prevotellaceae bacterium]